MKIMKWWYFFILIIVIILACGWGVYTSLEAKRLVLYKEKFVLPYIEQVMSKINTPEKKFKVYTANFTENDAVPKIENKEENSILWLGGYNVLVDENVKKFGLILSSSPISVSVLRDFFKLPAYYMPIGITENVSASSSVEKPQQPLFALVGNPPYIKKVLKKLGFAYQQFSLTDAWSKTIDMSPFTAVFAENAFYSSHSLDIPPLLIQAIKQKVPVASFGKGATGTNPVYLFNKDAFSYISENDLEVLISSILLKDNDIKSKIEAMSAFTETFFSVKETAKRLLNIMATGTDEALQFSPDTLLLSLPTHVGDHAAGDYWIGVDLIEQLTSRGVLTQLSFFNSFYIPPVESVIYIGDLHHISPKGNEKISVFYNFYPNENEVVDDKYFDDLALFSRTYDAFISASPFVTQQLNDRGVETVYLPQFTNPRYFYSDYDEKLASDILFVGNFHFERVAPLFALKHKFPITIYGDLWPDDVKIKAPYINNRILRRYYSSTKIVLNDTTPVMRQAQFVSNRIFDATACGTLVISDYIPEIERIYGDSVPMWKTEEEFVRLVQYYLDPAHEQERLEKAKRAQKITLANFTVENVAQKIEEIIEDIKHRKGLR